MNGHLCIKYHLEYAVLWLYIGLLGRVITGANNHILAKDNTRLLWPCHQLPPKLLSQNFPFFHITEPFYSWTVSTHFCLQLLNVSVEAFLTCPSGFATPCLQFSLLVTRISFDSLGTWLSYYLYCFWNQCSPVKRHEIRCPCLVLLDYRISAN